MAKNELSARKIKAALAKGEPCKLYDGGGLVLDIRSATSASWVYKFTLGKPDEVGLGSFFKLSMINGEIDLDPIRDEAGRCGLLVAKGQNPKRVRRAEKHDRLLAAAAPRPKALGELVKENIHLIAKKAKSAPVRQAWIDSLQFERIGSIAKMLPEEITDADAVALMKGYYAKAPVMADDVRQRLFKVLTWAVDKPGWRNPFRWEGHLEKHVVRKSAEQEDSHPALDHPRVGEYLKRLRGENERVMNALALEWLILSATRANETLEADWSEIDWASDCWVIPAHRMKMRREHAVPLTDRHHEILTKLKPVGLTEFPASGPVFPMPRGKGPSLTGVRKYMLVLRDPQGQPYTDPMRDDRAITPHGFRSTFRTWAEEQMQPDGSDYRYSEKLLEQCIAHKVGDATRNKYIRSKSVETRRQIMTAWADYCAVVQIAKAAPLRQRRAA